MHEVLRRFDRETGWLATGLLGGLILAAMAIGVQLQASEGAGQPPGEDDGSWR